LSLLQVSPELKERVRGRLEECSRVTGIYIKRLELVYDLKTATTLGEASYGWHNTIRLNPAYLNTHTDWYLEHICAHEFCHLATVRRYGLKMANHGPEWKAIMEAAGVTPTRTYEVELPSWVVVGPRQRIVDQPLVLGYNGLSTDE
jgi:predicted SprT family Zn-dependent metalloprotease